LYGWIGPHPEHRGVDSSPDGELLFAPCAGLREQGLLCRN